MSDQQQWPAAIIIERKPQDDPIRPLHYYVLDGTQSTDFSEARRYTLTQQHSGEQGQPENSGQDWLQTSLATVLVHFESEARSAGELADQCTPAQSLLRERYQVEADTYRYVLKQIRSTQHLGDGHLRPASRAHLALTAAVLQCIEAEVEPETIRRFVDAELLVEHSGDDQQETTGKSFWEQAASESLRHGAEIARKQGLLGDDQQVGAGAVPEYTITRCAVHRTTLETRPHDHAICPECGDFPPSIEHVIVVARADLQAVNPVEQQGVEERVEFRVVGDPDNAAPGHVVAGNFYDRPIAQRARDDFNPIGFDVVWRNIRIQAHTVTSTEWRDLPDE